MIVVHQCWFTICRFFNVGLSVVIHFFLVLTKYLYNSYIYKYTTMWTLINRSLLFSVIYCLVTWCFYFPLLLKVRPLHLFSGNIWVLIYSSHDFIQATKHESTTVPDPMKRHSTALAWTPKGPQEMGTTTVNVVSVSLPFSIGFSPSLCFLLIISKK